MSSLWPYPPEPPLDAIAAPASPAPSWDCPTGTCTCHAPVPAPEEEYRLHLFDHSGERMPYARCRLLLRDEEIPGVPPTADGAGVVRFEPPAGISQVVVEWAPANLPGDVFMPYRRVHELRRPVDPRSATSQRLRNLGFFGADDLEGNVRDYQRAYRLPRTGRWEHIAQRVQRDHDEGAVEPIPDSDHRSFRDDHEASGLVAGQALHLDDGGGAGGAAFDPAALFNQFAGSAMVVLPTTFDLVLRIGTPLREGNRLLTDLAGTTVTLDGRQLTPAVPAQTIPLVGNVAQVQMPNALGLVVVTVHPPPAMHTEGPAGPATTDAIRSLANTALDGVGTPVVRGQHTVPERRARGGERDAAEAELLRLEKAATALVVQREDAVQQGTSTTTIDPIDQQYRQVRRDWTAATNRRAQARASINRRVAQARRAYQGAVPPYLFRPFGLTFVLGPGGRVLTPWAEPRVGVPPFVQLTTRAARVIATWFPDWARADPRHFAWFRHTDDSFLTRAANRVQGKPPPVPTPPPVDAPSTRAPAPQPLVILHTTGGRDLPTDLAGLANANGGDAGAHYIVGRSGHVTKLCDDRFATFHGNPGYWEGERLINDFSVGIEIVTTGREAFTDAQILSVKRLLRELICTFGVHPSRVVGHGEVSSLVDDPIVSFHPAVSGCELHPTRRLLGCPGPHFPWSRLGNLTFKLTPPPPNASTAPPKPGNIRRLKQALAKIGYPTSQDNRSPSGLRDTGDDAVRRAYTVAQLRWFDDPSRAPTGVLAALPSDDVIDLLHQDAERIAKARTP